MIREHKLSIFLLRVALGWTFFYAGITKILDAHWSAATYLSDAKTFTSFYAWLAQPSILPIVNFLNEWGLLLIGVALILGVFVRPASVLGALMMLLYYFPILNFPNPGLHNFIVDEHIVYIFALLLLATVKAGQAWGIENWFMQLPFVQRSRTIQALLE